MNRDAKNYVTTASWARCFPGVVMSKQSAEVRRMWRQATDQYTRAPTEEAVAKIREKMCADAR